MRIGVTMYRGVFSLLCLLVLPAQGYAQDDPLFMSDEPLAITIEIPLATIIRDADSKPLLDGTIRFREMDGSKATIEISMTTRGRSRLAYCRFPPLKLNLKKKQAKGTLFDGQNKLKIVTHCRDGETHQRYLRQEFGIYKAYNILTDFSFRVRWITVTYKDSEGKRDDEVHDAFFIESNREVGERHGRERVMDNRISSAALDPVESSRYVLFQYLIANTDWSMIKGPGVEGCCHNGKILRVPGTTENWVVLPYDFDQAGLIKTKYALPAEALRIRSVRQRLYRGRCRHNPQLDATIALFNERREAMAVYLIPEQLSEREQNRARKYIEDFFEIINDPKKKQKKILEACVGA